MLLGSSTASGRAIRNASQLPNWNQHHDYRAASYNGINSAILRPAPLIPPYVTYDNLAADGGVQFLPNNRSAYRRGGGAAVFGVLDFYKANQPWVGNNMAGGGWHCFPTATSMWFVWWRLNGFSLLTNRGSEFEYIRKFAFDMDTNQERYQPRLPIGLYGTYGAPAASAINDYVMNSNSLYNVFGPRVRVWHYSKNGFRNLIRLSRPPLVAYRSIPPPNTPPQNGGHVVVGWEYEDGTSRGRVADPWDGTDKWIDLDTITAAGGGAGEIPYGTSPGEYFDADWEDASMMVLWTMDHGDAPSSYLQEKPTAHSSGVREWLGARTTVEVDPFDAVDDEDEIANVGDNDGGDDGVFFDTWNPGGSSQVVVTISSVSDMVVDPAFEVDQPATLYLNAWADWNSNGDWEDPAELIIAFETPADFEGTQLEEFAVQTPEGATDIWMRFRLARGDDVGPYGYTEFGEVEDYLVPVPEAASVWLHLAALLTLLGLKRSGFPLVQPRAATETP